MIKTLVLFLALTWLTGCASQPPAKAPPPAARIPTNALAQTLAPLEGSGWQPLFDGKTLTGWRIPDFTGKGPVHCESNVVVIAAGSALNGITWTNAFPTMDYEVVLDAMRVDGSDFFCGLTFPVGDSWCSLIVGGWGGMVTGISSIDGEDASENDTTRSIQYETGHWYRVRVRVTQTKIQAWLDDEKIVSFTTTDRKIGLRYGEIELSKPFGLATWQTTGAIRELKFRRL